MTGNREWFEEFFDDLYYDTYTLFESEERNEREARFIAEALDLPEGSRVLDLGCGYARHAVYLAKMGFEVVCFDLSDYMLSKARKRIEDFKVADRVIVVKGDMRRLDYTGEFDATYMFFTTFGYFSDEENREVIHRVSRALKPGGRLLIDLQNPVRLLSNIYLGRGEWKTWFEAGDYIVLEETIYDLREARIKSKRIFIDRRENCKVAERNLQIRTYMLWELEQLLVEASLETEKVYGDYKLGEYGPASPRMVVVAAKRLEVP
ncbi:MAG: methyltransferase domain-containing protein [Desulfurococcales archaeon]|nr:methyltransferase domain-containing protein [Desulfurococcales archaeon]